MQLVVVQSRKCFVRVHVTYKEAKKYCILRWASVLFTSLNGMVRCRHV